MKTSILTPKELFQKDVRYTIPPFQRPYVWKSEEQWEPLWEDVRNLAENYLDELERADNDRVAAERETRSHFLGAVILKQVLTAARDIEEREVVDGQQRVTTLQLLLNAVQQTCQDLDLKQPAKRLSKLVTNDEELIAEQDHIFKLWPTSIDQTAFRHAMGHGGHDVDDFRDSQLVQAHEFFRAQVRNWLEYTVVHDRDHKIEALEAATTALLQVVVIDLSAEDDSNVIFETMNARGTPLEQSDLIKNFVLSEDRESDLWGNLSEDWWRVEVRQGRQFRPRLDMLLNYWLAMRTGSDVPLSSVFDRFREHVAGSQIRAVMSDLKSDLGNYKDYEASKGDTFDEKLFYYRMDVMQAGVITPVLLRLLAIDQETRIRSFHALESFLIRRMICRQTTKDYNRLVLDLAIRLRDDLGRADEIVIGFLREQKAYSRKWPSDHDVLQLLETAPLYRLLTRGRLRLVLEGIEHRLRCTTKAEQPEVPRGLTIEHLMPQGWEKDRWPLPESADPASAEQDRGDLIHSIGNLTLTTRRLNSSMSNDSWDSKRDEIAKHSVLLLNGELMSNVCWNEESIRARSRCMAKRLSEFWPGPESQEMGIRHPHRQPLVIVVALAPGTTVSAEKEQPCSC